MSSRQRLSRSWLIAVIAVHLVISLIHGSAHSGARVLLAPGATLFVFVVILAGPVAGLALMWRASRPGALIVAVAMAGAFVFGVVNHFILVGGGDHVSHVDPAWRAAFASTAVLLAFTELVGFALAIAVTAERRELL